MGLGAEAWGEGEPMGFGFPTPGPEERSGPLLGGVDVPMPSATEDVTPGAVLDPGRCWIRVPMPIARSTRTMDRILAGLDMRILAGLGSASMAFGLGWNSNLLVVVPNVNRSDTAERIAICAKSFVTRGGVEEKG